MKLKFRVAPSLKDKLSTQRVMRDLTIALTVVLIFSCVFYGMEYGTEYLINIFLLLVASVVTSTVLELIFAKAMKIPYKRQMSTSFPWVTPLILVLIMPVNTPVYAMTIATAIAVFFGKLVYGGLGHNVFNPAGLGRAVLGVAFAGQVVEDLSTAATPIGSMNSYGWLLANESVAGFVEQFGGWQGLLTGWHAGSLGETSFLLIILLGVFLIVREAIDWRVPVFYIATVFLCAAVVGFTGGAGIYYPIYHVVTGGVAFGAVFMLTDPVTNPTHPYGRALFAVGAGVFTVLLRVNAAMPGGVVFAILFMNMLSPLITRILEGNQIKTLKKARITMLVFVALGLGLSWLSGSNMQAQVISESPVEEISITEADGEVTYELSSPGFVKANPNVYVITIDTATNTITNVECTVYNDTPGYGDKATAEDNISLYEGIVVSDVVETDVDAVSGATLTSDSIKIAVEYAIAHYNEGGQ
ncbi:MAG: FMN-binding protein [Erysipelothrix sp.]|nr:FMN-binding protein [Erysipelothrix sp.]